MSAEETIILNLFDSYWFECGVFAAKPPLLRPTSKTSTPVLDHHHRQVQDEDQDQESPTSDDPRKLNRITTLMRKSYSDQFLSSKDCLDYSSDTPKSVLGPQLQTILSGKEVDSFQDSSSSSSDKQDHDRDNSCVYLSHAVEREIRATQPERINNDRRRKRRIKSGSSRSLSELEFEELKGFMDLGFVFSDEQEMDSRLVSIIPGLQRFGKNNEPSSSSSVSRPYLSEAWDSNLEDELNGVKKMDWRIPDFGNEMELKDHLRFWAHSVASTVK